MGTDTPIAVLSRKPKLLYNYFKQNFAQVTNPPIDPIREELVMTLVSMIGPRPNLLGRHAGTHKRLEVAQPVLTNADLEKIRSIRTCSTAPSAPPPSTPPGPPSEGAAGLEKALDRICCRGHRRVLADSNILILSDRAVSADRIPIPALLATAAVHHHLIRQGLRMQTGLVVETGEAREVHHFCVPGRLWRRGDQSLSRLRDAGAAPRRRTALPLKPYEVQKNYIKAIGKGMLKVMSKMGISTYQSYCGAQIFDAVGLHRGFIEKYFTGTATTIEGVGLDRDRRGDACAATATPMATIRSTATCSMSAATTPSACAARITPGRRRAWPACSMRCAATLPAEYKAFADRDQRAERAPADHPRPDAVQVGRAGRSRSTRSSRRPRSSSASPPAR